VDHAHIYDIDNSEITAEELQSAIHQRHIAAYYQPKVDWMYPGRWVSTEAEMLARWESLDRGLVMPVDFIPLAEESGMIAELSESLLHVAIDQLAHWHREDLPLRLSVNVPAQLVTDLGFAARVALALENAGIDGQSLTMEITETVAMSDPERCMDVLMQLREARIGLAIDDFGMGHSSLKQLYEMPFSELKIHSGFVRELTISEEARVIVRATIDLAHALSMRVCAEGVEDLESLELLEEWGCDTVQGFYFGVPQPGAEYESWARRHLAS
jgi:EAL domain-containing protein (putative c-di-GMP-specific phosphodiesterase class I)